MKGIYAGSFNPWHKGHEDILKKALRICNEIVILICQNGNKSLNETTIESLNNLKYSQVSVKKLPEKQLLKDFCKNNKINVNIRGLRNEKDLTYEKDMLYWNEDLGLEIPTVHFISDRRFCHISSSAIRSLDGIK